MTAPQLALDIPLPAPATTHRRPPRPRGVVPADRPDARWIRTTDGLRPITDVPTRGLL